MPDFCTGSSPASIYWRHGLWRIDLALWRFYSLGRATRIAGKHRPSKSRRPGIDFTYGETPWATMRRILQVTRASPQSRFLELGAGTGRFAMFASRLGMQAGGIELVRPFVKRGNQIAQDLGLECDLVAGDLFNYSWGENDIIYVAATAFAAESVQQLSRKCRELAPGTRIAITTYGLEAPGLTLEHTEVLDFSWGPSTVFVYQQRAKDG
jgi:SAM-dependent methyltransferase